jgi:hypothetical protein
MDVPLPVLCPVSRRPLYVVGITSSWCYPMSAPLDKAAGTATDFLAYCHTTALKGFFGPCDGEKILVIEFSSGQLSHQN